MVHGRPRAGNHVAHDVAARQQRLALRARRRASRRGSSRLLLSRLRLRSRRLRSRDRSRRLLSLDRSRRFRSRSRSPSSRPGSGRAGSITAAPPSIGVVAAGHAARRRRRGAAFLYRGRGHDESARAATGPDHFARRNRRRQVDCPVLTTSTTDPPPRRTHAEGGACLGRPVVGLDPRHDGGLVPDGSLPSSLKMALTTAPGWRKSVPGSSCPSAISSNKTGSTLIVRMTGTGMRGSIVV